MEDNSLQHHGVKGQRWGVRRFQRKDGTLTPAGKKRLNKEMDKLKTEEKTLKNKQRTQAKLDKLETKRHEVEELKRKSTNKKTIKDLSDDDLRKMINRMKAEKEFKQLVQESQSTSKGKEFTKQVVKDVAQKWIYDNALDIGKQATKHYMAKFANKLIGETDTVTKKVTKKVKNEETGEIDEVTNEVVDEIIKEIVYANNKKKS